MTKLDGQLIMIQQYDMMGYQAIPVQPEAQPAIEDIEILVEEEEKPPEEPELELDVIMPEPYNKMSQYQLYAIKGNKKVLLPLRSVNVRTELRGATAITSVELTYYNPS